MADPTMGEEDSDCGVEDWEDSEDGEWDAYVCYDVCCGGHAVMSRKLSVLRENSGLVVANDAHQRHLHEGYLMFTDFARKPVLHKTQSRGRDQQRPNLKPLSIHSARPGGNAIACKPLRD